MRVTGWDQPPLQIMQMMYCFINNIHVDYAELRCEGIHYSLLHSTSLIPYPRFMKIIIGRYKDKDGMKILDWMISKEMKQAKHYHMYVEVFGIDVPLTQSQPTESTQGMHRTPSAPRSTRLTPPAPVPTVDKADELILQDTLQMVEGQENVVDDSSIPKNAKHNILDTRLEPMSDKESPEVEFTDVVIPVNVYDEEDEITDEELQGRYGYLFEHLRAKFMPRKSFVTLSDHLHEAMADSLPTMVDKHFKEQVQQQVPKTPAVRPRDQDDPHDDAHPEGENSAKRQKRSEYETDSYASEDDEIPTKQVSQHIMKEVSLNIDEAKLKKIADEMLRQRCTSGDEHQYHIDHMKNFLKSGIRDPEARYGVEHWKNPHAKIFYIRKQKEPGKPKEVIYSNSKIIQVIKTYWELGHEHKFITEIISRRANECIVSIIEPDFKNLNKNDIEDMYLLIMNGKVPDYVET
uniref:Uncharacterized protein n=1 Tax=Tanacetum cinerariifolium TaxID=118510 RepID=A0A699IRN5_TANCI|nr:hypothetical protein [Tanacetum cinerariifolium]